MKKLIPAALLTFLAPLLVLASLVFQQGTGTAQGPVELGTDTNPDGNTETSLGTREGCISVNSGDIFDLDIFVSDVQDLIAWELYLQFDPSIIEVVDANLDMFLASNPYSSLIRKSDFYIGQHFLGAADRRLLGASGSGVLARVTFEAKAPGLSHVDIPSIDFDGDGDIDKGPRLTASGGIPVGDVTGDGVFDGPTYHALVAVDKSCQAATPTPTLPPSPTPPPGGGAPPPSSSPPEEEGAAPLPVPGDPTFEPPSSTEPPAAEGAASEEGPGSASEGEPEEASAANPSQEGAAGEGGGSGSSGQEEAADESEAVSAAAALAGEGTPAPSEPGGGSQPAPGGDSSSSGGGLPLWALGAIGAAVLATAAGASVYLAARLGGGSRRQFRS